MSQEFRKDAEHGGHGKNVIHLASCYLGPRSHAASAAIHTSTDAAEDLAANFPKDANFGNATVQNGARNAIAEMLRTSPSNITLTINTNDGFYIVKDGLGIKNGDKVVLYGSEYLDVKTPFVDRTKLLSGTRPIFVDGARDPKGRPLGFDLAEFEKTIRDNEPKLVVVSHVQFPNGFTTDLKSLAAICKKYGAPLVVDAAQSFGVLPLHPDELGISAVMCPLWKWIGGNRGTGFLYTAPEFGSKLEVHRLSASGLKNVNWTADVSTADLHTDGRRFETSTLPTESWIPTTVMLKEAATRDIHAVAAEVHRLHDLARELLANERIEIYRPPPDTSFGSILAFSLKEPYAGREGEIVERLWNLPKRINLTERAGFIRLAPHHFTSDESLRIACGAIRDAVNEL